MGEALEQMTKWSDQNGGQDKDKTAIIKFKSQLRDQQQEFSTIRKLFRSQCKAMNLFDQPAEGGGSSGVKNRRTQRLQNLSNESDQLDNTLRMTQDIISQGQQSSMQFKAQGEKLKGTESKLNKMGGQALKQSDSLITKIGSREKKNNLIIAFVISCCLAVLIFHYDFLGLGFLKGDESGSSEEEPANHVLPLETKAAEYNEVFEAKNSVKSVVISSDDIQEVKSKKWQHRGGINEKDTDFDKEMNAAFGDEEEEEMPKKVVLKEEVPLEPKVEKIQETKAEQASSRYETESESVLQPRATERTIDSKAETAAQPSVRAKPEPPTDETKTSTPSKEPAPKMDFSALKTEK